MGRACARTARAGANLSRDRGARAEARRERLRGGAPFGEGDPRGRSRLADGPLTMRRMKQKLTVYAYGKCGTCRKALAWLDGQKRTYELIDITLRPPTVAELRRVLASGQKLGQLYNTSGQAYREGKLSELRKRLGEDEQLELLASNGRLVKRPLVTDGEQATVGFDAARFAERWS